MAACYNYQQGISKSYLLHWFQKRMLIVSLPPFVSLSLSPYLSSSPFFFLQNVHFILHMYRISKETMLKRCHFLLPFNYAFWPAVLSSKK